MTLTYSLCEDDFINYHLFAASINKQIKKRRGKTAVIWGILGVVLGGLAQQDKAIFLSYYFYSIGIIILIFYPVYAKWRYRKYYDNNADKIFRNLVNKQSTVTLDMEKIQEIDDKHEIKFSTSEIESIYETGNYFHIKVIMGLAYIIPKLEILDVSKAVEEIKDICHQKKIHFVQMLNWKW